MGARKEEASLYLKEIVRDQDVFFIGLMETKLSSIDRREVDCLMGNDWEYFHYPVVGTSGGILVLWNRKLVSLEVMEASSQAIIGNLSVPNLGTWKVATIYGSRCWGDFNCIINKEEKRGGKRFFFSKGPREMKGFMMNSDFYDVGSVGPRFAWCNNKEGASRIWERLDRCMLNLAAIQKLPLAVTRHLARMASDHYPIVIKMDERLRFKSKAIKFEDTWRSYPTTKSINKEDLGVNWSVEDLFVLRNKVHDLKVTLKRLSTWWNQRAKARWHEEGDTNSKLFHNFATARRNGNRIFQIKDEFNNLHDEDDQIEKIFIKFFEKKWKHREYNFSVNELQLLVFQQGNNKSPDVRFSIIINGKNLKWINAQSGFRQGCPLSPYLFILCSQLMSNSLEQWGQSLGIQISLRGPKITHLLYADDALIFSYASVALANALKIIVEDFCKWTGQRVNVSKSQMMFGKVVSYSMKKRIARVLGFKVVKEMKYLGVKISLNILKMADFQEILSNVMDRLNAWSKKSLSLGGKLTLIESSLLSMPNFLISHSMVPKRVLHELEKLCRSFIWQKKDGTNGMHYVAWSDICKPRSLGGLGLHSPLLRIGSLRSKLAWNYIQKLNSLFHRAMKAKYGSDVMNGAQKTIISTAWQILLDGGRHLKMVVRWKMGKGDKINILNDTWLLNKCINRWPTYVDCDFLDGMYVQQLLLSNGEWNFTMLQRAFHPDLILLISQIRIEYEEEDRLELMKICTLEVVDYFSWVQKLKIFWWRLGKSTIPTNQFLKNRRILENALCARGCQELKKITTHNSGIVKIYCSIVYHSWKNRNDVKHGKNALPCFMVASNALFSAISKSSPYLTSWGTNLLRESQSTWCPPTKDWIKINVDASLLSSNLAGIGGVFRDHKGRRLIMSTKSQSLSQKKPHIQNLLDVWIPENPHLDKYLLSGGALS
ncbi:hypothetical protein KFK09_029434 [Dendrobium nobile]|uniref:Reverse transcriptase domain-containing protein n=1 Tax=Dendrobium nobile TaxID=94219 RepID=A0A8T3A0T7_DENNO|nr:hypothetical protein KFK09_029434 [Dendrobium nobile]